MNRIIVIDHANLMFRAIFSSRQNTQVPASFTYMAILVGLLKRLKVTLDDKVIMAVDAGRSWRKSEDHKYKAQRTEDREKKEDQAWWKAKYDEFNALLPRLEQALPYHFVKAWGYEADDTASVVCKTNQDAEIILISSDKDWEMLAYYKNVKIFSPISKKFKHVPNPMKVLLEKINGDVSDNLLEKPSSEREFEIRKRIVDLINLPNEVAQVIQKELDKMMPKSLCLNKIPSRTIRERLEKMYGMGGPDVS